MITLTFLKGHWLLCKRYYKFKVVSPKIEGPVRRYHNDDKVTGTRKRKQQTLSKEGEWGDEQRSNVAAQS